MRQRFSRRIWGRRLIGIEIRPAHLDDAAGACDVLRRSITELCYADHHEDPAILRMWLGNKTPAIVAGWITDPANIVLLAVDGDALLAVGAVKSNGEITLNYVSPDARFRGIGKAMLAQLESTAREQGNNVCRLSSTATAHRFYLACGYEDCGGPQGTFGTSLSMPMLKRLTGPVSP